MRKQRVVAGALVTLACGLAGGYLMLPANVMGKRRGERGVGGVRAADPSAW